MKRKLLVVDTETGGLDPSIHPIVSIAALVYHEGAVIDQLHEVINEGPGVLQDPEAQAIHGIDASRGKSPLQVVMAIEAMLQKHDMRSRVTICAHNAAFDVGFMKRLWFHAGKNFEKTFDYRHLCTQTGALLLEQAGRLTLPGGSASLSTLTKMWNIPIHEHDALSDALATVAVLKKELALLR